VFASDARVGFAHGLAQFDQRSSGVE